jgi:hypothetical protein
MAITFVHHSVLDHCFSDHARNRLKTPVEISGARLLVFAIAL